MRYIVSLRDSSGNWAEVGMSHRTILAARSTAAARRAARLFARGQPHRIECFPESSIYGEPAAVVYVG